MKPNMQIYKVHYRMLLEVKPWYRTGTLIVETASQNAISEFRTRRTTYEPALRLVGLDAGGARRSNAVDYP